MYHDFLLLGGAGLVGLQVARHIAQQLEPRRIVVASLLEGEANAACERLEREFGERISFVPAWGNLFVPTDLADTPRGEIMQSPALRARLLEALYDDFDAAYDKNHLVQMIRRHRPEVIVDCVNTATGLSYQNVWDGAAKVRQFLERGDGKIGDQGRLDLEALLLSQAGPQIIRHVRLLHRATTEYKTAVYLKVGTTGTGGMGLNIPYTHSEDKPSKVLLAKNEAAFGHTGLLFLLARTPNSPIVKEVKPAAMIGYKGVKVARTRDKHGDDELYAAQEVALDASALDLRQDAGTYEKTGVLEVPIVDTGENGVFTRGEFAAITALGQMEYITPEEIARKIVLEIRGANTGNDCVSAMDAAVLNPSYKAGLLRKAALIDLDGAEQESGIASVALGKLGPPELSKLLFEAQLLKVAYGSLDRIIQDDVEPATMSQRAVAVLESSGVAGHAPSIGIPILLPDGKRILRGPRINVPEPEGHDTVADLTRQGGMDRWARKGWVDLRPANMAVWKSRFSQMLNLRAELRDSGSAAATTSTYLGDGFEIGEVVAWVFNNEMGGNRIK